MEHELFEYGPLKSQKLNPILGTFLQDHGIILIAVQGSLARIGPNELVTDDPDVLRRMMAVRSSYERGPCKSSSILVAIRSAEARAGYNAMKFEPGRDNLFSMRDGVAHAKLRNKMAAGVRKLNAASSNQMS